MGKRERERERGRERERERVYYYYMNMEFKLKTSNYDEKITHKKRCSVKQISNYCAMAQNADTSGHPTDFSLSLSVIIPTRQ